jgi:hypothetical protein
MVQDSTQVIPRGCIVRRKRNLLFGKALKGDDVVRDNKDIAMVAGQIVSALCSADASDNGQNEGINLRQFAPRRLLARPSLVLIFEWDEETMVPRRVVAHVIREESLHERQLASPQIRLIKVGEQPLPVAPSMVVLRVCLENLFIEC